MEDMRNSPYIKFIPEYLRSNENFLVFFKLMLSEFDITENNIKHYPNIVNPDLVPEKFIDNLMSFMDFEYQDRATPDFNRELLMRARHIYEQRGTDHSIIMAATHGGNPGYVGGDIFIPGYEISKDNVELIIGNKRIFKHSKSRLSGTDVFPDGTIYRPGVIVLSVPYMDKIIRSRILEVMPAGVKFAFFLNNQFIPTSGADVGKYGELSFFKWMRVFPKLDYEKLSEQAATNMVLTIEPRVINPSLDTLIHSDILKPIRGRRSGRMLINSTTDLESYIGVSMLPMFLLTQRFLSEGERVISSNNILERDYSNIQNIDDVRFTPSISRGRFSNDSLVGGRYSNIDSEMTEDNTEYVVSPTGEILDVETKIGSNHLHHDVSKHFVDIDLSREVRLTARRSTGSGLRSGALNNNAVEHYTFHLDDGTLFKILVEDGKLKARFDKFILLFDKSGNKYKIDLTDFDLEVFEKGSGIIQLLNGMRYTVDTSVDEDGQVIILFHEFDNDTDSAYLDMSEEYSVNGMCEKYSVFRYRNVLYKVPLSLLNSIEGNDVEVQFIDYLGNEYSFTASKSKVKYREVENIGVENEVMFINHYDYYQLLVANEEGVITPTKDDSYRAHINEKEETLVFDSLMEHGIYENFNMKYIEGSEELQIGGDDLIDLSNCFILRDVSDGNYYRITSDGDSIYTDHISTSFNYIDSLEETVYLDTNRGNSLRKYRYYIENETLVYQEIMNLKFNQYLFLRNDKSGKHYKVYFKNGNLILEEIKPYQSWLGKMSGVITGVIDNFVRMYPIRPDDYLYDEYLVDDNKPRDYRDEFYSPEFEVEILHGEYHDEEDVPSGPSPTRPRLNDMVHSDYVKPTRGRRSKSLK